MRLLRFRLPLALLPVLVALVMPHTAAKSTASLVDRAPRATAAEATTPPNIVLVTTDDQTLLDLEAMPKTSRMLGERGVTFTDALSPHPLCCPARAEILTGQFAQNNGVRSNTGPFGGAQALADPDNTLPVWLQHAGYQTAFMGKYLNGYQLTDPLITPSGWDSWNGTYRGIYDYDDFTVNRDGVLETHADEMQADVYADITGDLITEMSGAQPFFIWQSQLAPHSQRQRNRWVPPAASARNNGTFSEAPLLSASSPSYNEEDVSDKPLAISVLPPITELREQKLTTIHQERLESLQDVDDAVAQLVADLKAAGEYRDTLIIFTSDNGYLMGEHRYHGKIFPYEESVRVPLLMAGARVPAGVVRHQTATLIDVAPTILDAADATPGRVSDGMSLLRVARSDVASSWDTVLLQAGPADDVDGGDQPLPDPALAKAEDTNWLYRGVRTDRYTYVRYPGSGEQELYDNSDDPWQLTNMADDPRYATVVAELRRRTAELSSCAGDCIREWGAMPRPSAF